MVIFHYSHTNLLKTENIELTKYMFSSLQWIPEVSYHCCNAPFLLVGTKLDIRDEDGNALNKSTQKQSTCISYNQGLKLANKLKIKYVECSAKTQKTLNVVIDEAIETVIADRKKVKGFRTRPMIYHSCVLYWCITRNSGSYCDNWNKYCSTYLIGRCLIAMYFWLSIYWSGVVLRLRRLMSFLTEGIALLCLTPLSAIFHIMFTERVSLR